jgi:hypothetical protein
MNAKAVNNMIFAIEAEALHRIDQGMSKDDAYCWMVQQWDARLGPHNIQVRIWGGTYEWQEVKTHD